MSNNSFNDLISKNCVITGGSGVLGSSMIEALISSKVNIANIGRSEKNIDDELKSKIEAKGIKFINVKADVLDKQSLLDAKKKINDELGKVDILVNCVGGNDPGGTTKVDEITEENVNAIEDTFFGLDVDSIKNVFDLNFLGTLLPSIVFSKDMIENKKGAIVNISSINSFLPLTRIPGYSGAKAAINNFTQWLAVHYAKMNVRVNAIAPGFFLAKQNKFLLIDEKTNELTARGNKIITNTPMGKFGEPEDLQGTLLYLCSDISKFVTGVVIPVDGGFTAYSGV